MVLVVHVGGTLPAVVVKVGIEPLVVGEGLIRASPFAVRHEGISADLEGEGRRGREEREEIN